VNGEDDEAEETRTIRKTIVTRLFWLAVKRRMDAAANRANPSDSLEEER